MNEPAVEQAQDDRSIRPEEAFALVQCQVDVDGIRGEQPPNTRRDQRRKSCASGT